MCGCVCVSDYADWCISGLGGDGWEPSSTSNQIGCAAHHSQKITHTRTHTPAGRAAKTAEQTEVIRVAMGHRSQPFVAGLLPLVPAGALPQCCCARRCSKAEQK